MRNTLKTIWGYLGTLVGKYAGIGQTRSDLASIYNYVRISDRLGTSGQPTEMQFAAIREAGFDVVINLLPGDVENSLPNEDRVVGGLGMEYVHIPVVFKAPREADFAQFVEAMNAAQQKHVWIHCAANARVSVFLARYRQEILGESAEVARAPIAQVWEPFGVWKSFLQKNDL